MADWLVTEPNGPLGFPRVEHRHPNGTMPAVRETTPTILRELGAARPLERWAFVCPCGEVYLWERRRP